MVLNNTITYEASITQSDFDSIDLWSSIINGVSLFGAFLVVIAVLVSNSLGLNASRRLSFRMSMWIAFSDMLFSIFAFVNVDDVYPLCPSFTAITYFCNLLYVFLTTSITLNLHLTLLCTTTGEWTSRIRHFLLKESVLVTLCCGLALLVTLPPLIVSLHAKQCVLFHLFEDYRMNILMLWLTIGFWEFACFVYTTVIVVLVIRTLNKTQKLSLQHSRCSKVTYLSPNTTVQPTSTSSHFDKVISKNNFINRPEINTHQHDLGVHFSRVARRIMFYPIIPLLTQSFYIIINSYFLYIGERTLTLLYLFYLVPYSAGLLNAIVFFVFDPAIPDILVELQDRYYNKNGTLNPTVQINEIEPGFISLNKSRKQSVADSVNTLNVKSSSSPHSQAEDQIIFDNEYDADFNENEAIFERRNIRNPPKPLKIVRT